MIRKLIVALVAAAMLVAMAVPAFAQELVPNGNGPNDEGFNLALANVEQECGIEQENENDQEQNTTVVQANEQNNEQNQTGVNQKGYGFIVINNNDGDVDQEQNNEQNAENNALVIPIQNSEQSNVNTGDVECDAAIAQLQDSLLLFLLGEEPNGEPNSA